MSTTTALIGPRVKPRTSARTARPAAVPSVLHIDLGTGWAGGQNQVRLLMHELNALGVRQMCLCPHDSALHARLVDECLPVRAITRRFVANPLGIATFAKWMRSYHVVHTHDAHALQTAILPAALLRVPIVASRRVSFRTSALKWNRADHVIAISESVRETLLAAGVDPWRVRLIHSGVDVREVKRLPLLHPSLRSSAGIPADAFVAGNVGSLVPYKNQLRIAEAAATRAGVHWVLIGDGPTRGAIEKLVASHHDGDPVFLAGHLDDARRALRELDVFAYTSIGEALGTSVLDAMALEIPVIAADSAGPAEVLGPVHAQTGATLYPPGDAVVLAQLVRRVRDDRALQMRMIVAQNIRLQDFRSDVTAMKTLDVYREVLR